MGYRILIYLSILLTFISCQNTEKEMKDGFYSNFSYGDIIRIPLIEPLELVSPDDGQNWFFKPVFNQLDNFNLEIDNVESYGVHDSLIVVYSKRLYIKSQMTEAWVVTDLSKEVERVFLTEKEYDSWIKSNDLDAIELYECNEAFQYFKNNGKLKHKETE